MRHRMSVTWVLFVCAIHVSCRPVEDTALLAVDLQPAALVEVATADSRVLHVHFNEPVEPIADSVYVEPDGAVLGTSADGGSVAVRLAEATVPGETYRLGLTVRDMSGNTTRMVTAFYGHNPRTPEIVINEFRPRGNDTRPDAVELRVVSGGDLGGVTLTVGTHDDHDARFVFPSIEVHPEELIVVHLEAEGLEGEVDELRSTAVSAGIEASPTARDFWAIEGGGLPGNNGVIVVYANPGGGVIDAVAYSNRTSDSDERYRGFGSTRMLEWVRHLVEAGAWEIAGDEPRPEDLVNPETSTATRTINRSSAATDTNGRDDWHIVPTRGSTIGEPNSDERHEG
jgi:hypothetical protein